MSQQDELIIAYGALGQVVIKLYWPSVASQEQALVHPVSDEEVNGGRGVHDWQTSRIEEGYCENGEIVGLAELKHELGTRILVFIVFLDKLLGLASIS